MSQYIDLDSIYRDVETHPNPADYSISPDKLIAWYRSSRRTRASAQNPSTMPADFVTSCKLLNLIIPYQEEFTTIRRLYVDFRSTTSLGMVSLISTIDNTVPDAVFACTFEKNQNDEDGNPVWMHWKGLHSQVMRFEKDKELKIRIFTSDGNTIPITDSVPPDPLKQTSALFEIENFTVDADYRNGDADGVDQAP